MLHEIVTIFIVGSAILTAAVITAGVGYANGMSDAPAQRFQGLGLIAGARLVAAVIVATRIF